MLKKTAYTAAMLGGHFSILSYLHKNVLNNAKWVEFLQSDLYWQLAFKYFEAGVNLWSAAIFILAPSFAAHQLTPYFDKDDKVYEHPALKICVRLFGATEILVGLLFALVLNKENASTFLKAILAADIAHYVQYFYYSITYPKFLEPSVIAHYVVMTSVLYTKYVYFMAAGINWKGKAAAAAAAVQ